MTDALTYDRNQGYTAAEVAFIQRLVGSTPDGQWGPNTVAAVQRWQAAQGIAADGKVWRSTSGNTWPRLLKAGAAAWWQGAPGISRVGLWTFSDAADPSNDRCAKDLELACEAALTDIVLTITNDSHTTFELLGTIDGIVEVGQQYKGKSIDVGLNSFVYPSTAYVDALADAVLQIDQQLGLRRLDLDAEELWIEHGSSSSWAAAADRLGQRLKGVQFEVGVNGIVYTSHTALDPLVRQECVTYVTPQAYSVAGQKSSSGKPNGTYNPIDLQVLAKQMWGKWWPDRRIIGGFATYDQAGTYELGTLTDDVAIGVALRSWADLGAAEVCGWSCNSLSSSASARLRRRVQG